MKKNILVIVLILLCFLTTSCSKSENTKNKTKKLTNQTTTYEIIDYPLDYKLETENDTFKILQLTDTQIAFADDVENSCYKYIRQAIETTSPDLIILTGDIVYGRYDTDGNLLKSIVSVIDGYNIPWAPVFGNHDNECIKGIDYQINVFYRAKNCLFKKRSELSGNGNYSIGIFIKGELVRTVYMLDSKGCSQIAGDTKNIDPFNISKEQKEFVIEQQALAKKYAHKDVKGFVCMHIMPSMLTAAVFDKYGVVITGVNSFNVPENDDNDFGGIGEKFYPQLDKNGDMYDSFKEANINGYFVGHEHVDNLSIVYDDTRFTYGLKSSTVDSYDPNKLGGTLITVLKDDFNVEHKYYIKETK